MLLKLTSIFNKLILLSACLGIYVVFYKFQWTINEISLTERLWNPAWMLFGPLLHLALRSLSGARITGKDGLHLVPAAIITVIYAYVWFAEIFHYTWAGSAFAFYQSSYLVISISLITYSCLTLNRLYSAQNTPATDLLVMCAAIYIIIATLMILMYLCWNVFKIDMGIDYRFFSYFLLLSMCFLGFRYLLSIPKALPAKLEDAVTPMYANSQLSTEMAERYKKMITDCFENTNIYLKSDLSLELLSKTLDIPKHILSQIFTVHMKLTFYKFVAQYRINYAIEQMKSSNGMLTIESLAYECGFNSKTSFNKYFKQITNLTPQEYQRTHLDPQRTP
ncbi:AraC family transcriptional regulator [Pedobacter sp. PF22-3]|uniref:helix-turn-helix domain-containing protein n=1 Tax=Pedobacter sp. PF22-3 TaxID=2994467 RepID=UPI0022459FA1|nr:AraC family transcriptional regulator [Pedobacter sp. PF22-3]MCX2495289.1 AraC family transcriptional regulator [Pedobacter sp. PF22-3]